MDIEKKQQLNRSPEEVVEAARAELQVVWRSFGHQLDPKLLDKEEENLEEAIRYYREIDLKRSARLFADGVLQRAVEDMKERLIPNYKRPKKLPVD